MLLLFSLVAFDKTCLFWQEFNCEVSQLGKPPGRTQACTVIWLILDVFHLLHVCGLRSHVQWTGNGYDVLDSLPRSFTPNLHVHSDHSPQVSRSYCWAGLSHIQKSVNQLNITFLDILRGGSWEKSGSPRVPPSPSSDNNDLHQNTLICMHFKEKIKEWILFFLAPPQAKWKREQKHVLCLKVAKSLHRNTCPGSLGASPRDQFSRHHLLNAEGKGKKK